MPMPGRPDIAKSLSFLFLFIISSLQGQNIFFELFVEPEPPVYAYQWQQNPDLVVLYVTNYSTSPQPVILKGRLYDGAGVLVGETENPSMPVTLLDPELSVLHPVEFVPSSALVFYGGFEEDIIRTNRIPEGVYQLCIELLDPEMFQPITPVQCATFFIQGYNPPFLIYPPDGHSMTSDGLDNMIFQFTPVSPLPSDFIPFYRFGFFELFEGQAPREALSANPPIYETLLPGETQLYWPPEILLPPTTTQFTWSVQALNEELLPMTAGDGWSEPSVIIILEDTTVYTGDTIITTPKVPPEVIDTTTTVPKVPPEVIDTTTTVPKVPPEVTDTTATVPKVPPEVIDTTATVPKVPPVVEDTTTTVPRVPPSVTDTTITEVPIPRVVSDPTQPVPKIPPEITEPPIYPPPEYPPPDTIVDPFYCLPRFFKDPANPIDLGMVVEDPGLFPYPRAVPIRAEGIDHDYAIFRCVGCDGNGRVFKAVEDQVSKFNWVLKGKGSLNTPFELEAIQASQDSLKNILSRLREIEDSLEWLHMQIDSLLPERIREAEARHEEKLAEESKKDSLLTVDKALRDSISTQLDSIIARMGKARTDIASRADSIAARISMIDSLNAILAGRPSQAMLGQLEVVALTKQQLEDIMRSLDDKIEEIAATGEALAQAVRDADSLTVLAVKNYQDLRTQTEEISLRITEIETELMADPDYREFLRRKREWNQKTYQFNWFYHSGDTVAYIISNRQQQVNSRGVAAIVVADPETRLARFQEFMVSMVDFRNVIFTSCNHHGGAVYDSCIVASGHVQEASGNYTNALDTLVQSGFVYDLALAGEQDSLRQVLVSLEQAVKDAKTEVENRAEEADAARAEYVSEMDRLEEEKRDIEAESMITGDTLSRQEMTYETLKKANADSLEKKRQDYLDRIQVSRARIQSLEKEIAFLGDSLQMSQKDSVRVEGLKNELDLKIAEQETYLGRIGELIANLEQLVDKLNNDLNKARNDRERLEKEKEELLKKKEEEEKKQEQQFSGNKTASGIFVYYIPPPLEDIMKDKPEFERLKKEVERAEDSLAFAYDFKQQVQFRLVKEIERIARNLKKYGELEDMAARMEEQKTSLAEELAKLKNSKTIEQKDKQKALQDILDKAKEGRQTAEDSLASFEADSLTIRDDIEYLRAAIGQKDDEIENAENTVRDMNAQLQFEEGQLRNARQTLETRSAELTEARYSLNLLQESLGRAKNDLTRAHAKDNEAGINSANQEILDINAQIKSTETLTISLQASVNSAANSVESAQLRVNNALESQRQAVQAMSDLKKLRMDLEDGLINKHGEMEGVMSGLQHWRKTRDFAENLENKVNKAREDLQEAISKGISQDEQVAAMEKEMKELEERIGKTGEAMAVLVSSTGESVKKKDEIIDEAEEKLETAKKRLEKAEGDLRAFLVKEFETVKLEVSIELTGDDDVVDGYRSDDTEVKLEKKLEYKDNRVPIFESKRASGSLDDKKFAANCDVRLSFEPGSAPVKAADPSPGREPRTIALVYKNGRPLWPEWPVIPQNKPLLAKDVVQVSVAYSSDIDAKRHACLSADPECITPAARTDGIVDLGNYIWDLDGRLISHHPMYNRMMWEPDEVKKPLPEQEKKLDCDYIASYLAGDPPVKAKSKPVVKPGVLLEVTDSIVRTPNATDTVIARVVTGDHKGLAGEEIEFSLVRVSGESEDYGFEGTDTIKVKKTDGQGYARVEFRYGDGFAKFKIFVKWKRGDKVLEEDELYAIAPIRLQFVRFGSGIGTDAWKAAFELFESGEIPGEERMKSLAEQVGDDGGAEADSTREIPVHAIAGLLDEERDFVEEETVIFSPPPGITVDPDSVKTAAFGLARTDVGDIPPDAILKMSAHVEEKYTAVGRPPSAEIEMSTTKVDRFRIGSADNPFVILLDDPVSEGEEVNGTGKLGAEIADGLMISLLDVALNINQVELDGPLEEKVAVSGTVSWAAKPGVTASVLGFELTMDSLVITAAMGAGIGGQVNHASLPTPVRFYAEMDPTGDFLGTISDLPEVVIAGFKLREGASFSIDMHTGKDPEGFTALQGEIFKGIVIHSTSIELPDVFNTNEGVTPSALHAENLYIGSSGVGGKVSYSGALLKFGFAGYDFEIDSVLIDFNHNELKQVALGGSLKLPSPMEGTIRAVIGKAGDSWSAQVSTGDPVSIPRLATAFSLLEGTGLEYNTGTGIATFRLDAVISSEKYGDITIREFLINSEGEISAKNISVNKAVRFGSGFTLAVDTLSFLVSGEEYNLTLVGGFSFPLIGVDELRGMVTVAPGPEISVGFKKLEIGFSYSPVDFKGKFEYSGNEFKGQFAITLENLKQIEGISGLLIIGNTESAPDVTYTYWYAEIVLAGAVPLGQTGLSLLELGGGLGYNYNPPVGSAPGSPSNTTKFSFKAIIGMGTTPGGEIMAGRMEMVLAEGYFTLYGKLWILKQEESMYGEGRLSIFWSPVNKLEGFVGMFIGIPDADGDVLFFEGKVNFLYSDPEKFIRSEKIEGSFLHALHANASIDVTPEHIKLDGRLYYNLDKKISLKVVTVIAVINVDASGHFYYIHPVSTLSTGLKFHGDWDIDLDTPLGVADIVSGSIDLQLQLLANPEFIDVAGSAEVAWKIWFYSGSVSVDAGYRVNL